MSDFYKISLIFFFGLWFFRPVAHSQSCLTGRIVALPDYKAVAEANVSLGAGKGSITDSKGYFRICNLNSGKVLITVSHLGFESFQMQVELKQGENTLPEIQLKPVSVNMDEVVVTATRTDNYILNTPVRLNLINARQLNSVPVQNIDEVLKYAPGVNYNRAFGIYSTKANVTMRGLSGKEQGRVLVLLDGVPLNKSDGGTVDWNLVDINSVQKIEIMKGAGSALYGGNAMGGIINILSKKPQEKLFIRASAEYGTYNTRGARLNTGGMADFKAKPGGFYWLFNSFYKKSDGYITQSEADVRANPYITKSNMEEMGANLKTGVSLGKNHSIEAGINYYNDRRGTGEKVHQPEGNTTDHDSYGITLSYKGRAGAVHISSTLYNLNEDYKKVNEYLKDDYTWYEVLSTRRDYGWLNSMSMPLGRFQILTAGFDYKNGSVDAYDKYFTSTDIVYNQGSMNTYAVFAQNEIRLANDKFRIIAGLRFDMASFYNGSFRIEAPSPETEFMFGYQVPDMPEQQWNAFSPRLSAQYKWKSTDRVYFMYSHGFRPSVLDDLCRSGRIKGGFKIANPSVKPEYLNNFETGIDVKPVENLFVSASAFYSRGKDFQYYVSNGQTIDMGFGDRPIFIRANISEVEMYGAEAELRYDFNALFSVFANYSYTHSVILNYAKIALNDTIDLSGKFLTDVPNHILSCGANWNNRWVNAGLFLRYTGRMYINDQNSVDEILISDRYPAYTTLDLKLWKPIKKHCKVSLNIQNLLDVKYYDSKYAVCPGRFITAEFSVHF
ncbi:MAG TPA: TonB-dependent receptor [Lentimicrobium sp.]|nr:TonB-dependent receptor [Lentimicrobium sp.]